MQARSFRVVFAVWILITGTGQTLADGPDLDTRMVERGRYLARIGGCNDCRTPGYFMNGGTTPESLWLTGDKLSWRGPWGTIYAANLRLFVRDKSEQQWVDEAKVLKRRPPMPWFNLNAMHEQDLRALYQFIKFIGAPGEPAPAYVPPDQEPPMPYVTFPAPPAEKQ